MGTITPFVKIEVAEQEITNFVLSFTYEDCVKTDNLLMMELQDATLKDLYDDGVFDSGRIITFIFGYVAGVQSETHVAVIFDVKRKYRNDGTLSLAVYATDQGTVCKEGEFVKIWENVKSSDIALEIAGKYNLKSQIEDTIGEWTALPQGGRTDFEFLEYLAGFAGDGNFIFFVRGDTLYFGTKGSEKASAVTYEYGNDDRILNFRPSLRSISKNKESAKIETKTVDPKKAQTEDIVVDDEEGEMKGIVLGEFKTAYDSGTYKDLIKKHIVTPEFEKVQVETLANKTKKEAEYRHLIATLDLEGDPLLEPDSIITMDGNLVNADLGNWYVEKVTHKISGSFRTSLMLVKNASNHKVDETKSEPIKQVKKSGKLTVNKTKGEKKKDETIVVHVYDANGILKGGKTKSGEYVPF